MLNVYLWHWPQGGKLAQVQNKQLTETSQAVPKVKASNSRKVFLLQACVRRLVKDQGGCNAQAARHDPGQGCCF